MKKVILALAVIIVIAVIVITNTNTPMKFKIDIQGGFFPAERVVVSVDGKVVYDKVTSSNATVEHAASLEEMQSGDTKINLKVELLDRKLEKEFAVNLEDGSYLGIGASYRANLEDKGEIRFRQQDTPFGYD